MLNPMAQISGKKLITNGDMTIFIRVGRFIHFSEEFNVHFFKLKKLYMSEQPFASITYSLLIAIS